MVEPDFTLPITEEEYETAGSKFVQFPAGAQMGDSIYLDVEVGMLDWDTPGKSMKLPVTITEEGTNNGKEEKISFGVTKDGIWKGKQIYLAITGHEMPMVDTPIGRSPRPDRLELAGKKAVGQWQLVEGKKQGGTGDSFPMAKLIDIRPAGDKPAPAESLLQIPF